jgi:hypothetical protein
VSPSGSSCTPRDQQPVRNVQGVAEDMGSPDDGDLVDGASERISARAPALCCDAQQARKGMQEKAEQGIWPTKCPLGYRNGTGPDGRMAEGQRVRMQIGQGQKGPEARSIELLD